MSSRNALFIVTGLVLGLGLAWLLGPARGAAQLRAAPIPGPISIASTPQGVFVARGAHVWVCEPTPSTPHGPGQPSCSTAERLER